MKGMGHSSPCRGDSSISDDVEVNSFWHLFYEAHVPQSHHFDTLLPLVDKLGARCVVQAKANLYPCTHILHEHRPHADYDSTCSGAILSLNTCDGYTKLKDGTKIDSVANRVLLHDPSIEHCGTSTTNVSARININVNYIKFH